MICYKWHEVFRTWEQDWQLVNAITIYDGYAVCKEHLDELSDEADSARVTLPGFALAKLLYTMENHGT